MGKAVTINALGVMTGTSCDGADAQLLKLTLSKRAGVVSESVASAASKPFSASLRRRLLSAQAGNLSLKEYGRLQCDYSLWLAEFCNKLARRWGLSKSSTVLGIHGQTLWHEPPSRSPDYKKPGFSIQMLDGCLLATRTGFVVVSQFRQPDLAMGGQGAPLVPLYHSLLARGGALGAKPPLVIFNIGGISNISYIRPKGEILAFDTGPGNALIDLATDRVSDGVFQYDHGGRIASSGTVDWSAVRKLAQHPYLKTMPPKSTGRELFDVQFLSRFKSKGVDLVADVTAFTAFTMAQAYTRFVPQKGAEQPTIVFIAGGGVKNPVLIKLFRACLKEMGSLVAVSPLPDGGVGSEYLEAAAFARFSVEALIGHAVALPSVTGAKGSAAGAAIYQSENFTAVMKRLTPLF